MPDTFFTASPHWEWFIILYFFVGGIAGGSFILAALLDFFGRPADRALVRLGYYVALGGVAVSGILLTADLPRPERFWHMLIESNTGRPMFKAWSPMSVGVWGVSGFGLFAFLASLGAVVEAGVFRWRVLGWAPIRALAARGPALAIAGVGSLFGFLLAGYTGVLLAVSNRPIWADSSFLGLLFLVSAASTAAACLILLGIWRKVASPTALDQLARFDRGAMGLELVALVLFLGSLGPAARLLFGWWGLLLVVGVVGAGILVPLAMERRGRKAEAEPGHRRLAQASALVLLGGLLLRVVVILSSNGTHVIGSGVSSR
ncbi:MAG TPA: NrfD/PsrC family molybdoenzyme membrane anchor subunit [Gemmatimonadales bacterium]|nr:NrfD/PsrC family molybdoenzyme membrane anchor subunit [Gemmatimonadales bacterium]